MKVVQLTNEQVSELGKGIDIVLTISPKRTIMLTTVSDVERKKKALLDKFEREMAKLQE